MPTLLFINACVRGRDSRTLALAEHLLERIREANSKDMARASELIPKRLVCAPSVNRKQCPHVHIKSIFLCLIDIPLQ